MENIDLDKIPRKRIYIDTGDMTEVEIKAHVNTVFERINQKKRTKVK